jgi:crotonobetaine/carnitine-CoA ligase
VMAVLTLAKPAPAAEIWQWCQGRIPAFAIPRFLRFVDALPKTPSEKIRKAELRAAGVTEDTFDRSR